jgi:hypothetical protein
MDSISFPLTLLQKPIEWIYDPLRRFLSPPPQLQIVPSRTFLGRHETQDGPFALLLQMRLYNKSSQATSVQAVELAYDDTVGEPQRMRPRRLFTEQGWVVDFPRREENILVDRHIPPMNEVERFAYFFLLRPVEPSHLFTVKVTFVTRRSRKVTFRLTDRGSNTPKK